MQRRHEKYSVLALGEQREYKKHYFACKDWSRDADTYTYTLYVYFQKAFDSIKHLSHTNIKQNKTKR